MSDALHGEVRELPPAELIDERRGLREAAAQIGFRLVASPTC